MRREVIVPLVARENGDPEDILNLLWQCFASGLGVACPIEAAHLMALLVHQTPVAYQFRCTACSWHSDWFVVRDRTAMAVRHGMAPGGGDE